MAAAPVQPERIRISGGGALGGALATPGDKSISHRALILGALADGWSELSGLSDGEDVARTEAAVRVLGAEVALGADGAVPGDQAVHLGFQRVEPRVDQAARGLSRLGFFDETRDAAARVPFKNAECPRVLHGQGPEGRGVAPARMVALDPAQVSNTLGVLLKYQDDIAKIEGATAQTLIDETRAELRRAELG